MTTSSWDVPVVRLNKHKVVIDLGEGRYVNLVGLENQDSINFDGNNYSIKDIQSDKFGDSQFNPGSPIHNLVTQNSVKYKIQLVSRLSGGRHSHRRLIRSRRATRLTRRRRV